MPPDWYLDDEPKSRYQFGSLENVVEECEIDPEKLYAIMIRRDADDDWRIYMLGDADSIQRALDNKEKFNLNHYKEHEIKIAKTIMALRRKTVLNFILRSEPIMFETL